MLADTVRRANTMMHADTVRRADTVMSVKSPGFPIPAAKSAVIIFLLISTLICLFPLIMALLNSFKTKSEMFTSILALPVKLQLDNYARSLSKMHYLRSFTNTVVITAGGITGIVLFGSLAGWALCRIRTRLAVLIFSLFVFSMLIPFHAIMIPLYRVAQLFNLSNSLLGMWVMYSGLGVGMAIFMYHGFVKSIPLDLEDAAYIDGCGLFGTFRFVVFPLLVPITVTISIMNILWMWNDFLLPLIMLQSTRRYTLLLSTNMLFGQYSSDWPAILSALILTVIPVIVLYVLLQRHILAGIVEGALKG